MDELRFVRRDDHALIVTNDAGDEFRLIVDDTVLSELRHLSRRERDTVRVRPREIQALIRAGKTRAEVAEATGLEEVDIERYEEPVLAERRYILERAHAVPVRTGTGDDEDQRFGAVISERLVSLGSDTSEWSSWRDEERGWMIALEFISHDLAHRAVWAFDHRKSVLSPVNPDAVNLSKQGDVGDRLIPKLRAVDDGERSGRFDSDAFDRNQLPIEVEGDERPAAGDAAHADDASGGGGSDDSGRPSSQHPASGSGSGSDAPDEDSEYARRREIDQRAIKSSADEAGDLSQTADLLDALRRRRGEREQQHRSSGDEPPAGPEDAATREDPPAAPERPQNVRDDSSERPSAARNIWSVIGSSSDAQSTARPAPQAAADQGELDADDAPTKPAAPRKDASGRKGSDQERSSRKGRASIPSWDDILFGTRSEDDPA